LTASACWLDFGMEYGFCRLADKTPYCSLKEDEAASIAAAINGCSFGEICEILYQLTAEDKAALRAASLLKGWLMAELIAEIKY